MAGYDHEYLTAILDGLLGYKLRRVGDQQWRARCPAHDGANRESLQVGINPEGRVLLTCHSRGCSPHDILRALNIDPRRERSSEQAAEIRYVYSDYDGIPVFSQVRGAGKKFRQETWDIDANEWVRGGPGRGKYVLYHLPCIRAAVEAGDWVYYVEGEKDADNLNKLGLHSTTHAGGASGWRSHYVEQLRGVSRVVVIPDRDEPGVKMAQQIVADLAEADIPASIIELPFELGSGKDVSDLLAMKGGADQLKQLVRSVHSWQLDEAMGGLDEAIKLAEDPPPPVNDYGMLGLGPGFDIPGVGGGVFTVVAARPGIGKTSWMIELAWRIMASGERILFCSYDEPAARMVRYLAGSILGDYRYAHFEDPDCRATAAPVSGPLAGLAFNYDERPRPVGEIARAVAKLKPHYVFIDHLALIPSASRNDGPDRIREVCEGLRRMANDHAVGVVAASQINRVGLAEGVRHELEHLYGGDAIGQFADAVLGLQRPQRKTPDDDLKWSTWERAIQMLNTWERFMFVYAIKNRLGPTSGDLQPCRVAGAERRFFPFHPSHCDCRRCMDHVALVTNHGDVMMEINQRRGTHG